MDYFNNINSKCVKADWIGRYMYIYACKLKKGKAKKRGWICRKEKKQRNSEWYLMNMFSVSKTLDKIMFYAIQAH